jgi:hypothetical protein
VIAVPDDVNALKASVKDPVVPSDGIGVTWASFSVAGATAGAEVLPGDAEPVGVFVPATLSEHAASPKATTIATIRDLSRDGRTAIKGSLLVE